MLDCDSDGVPDPCAISSGVVSDCDFNTIPDECSITADPTLDCDLDGGLDVCQLNNGTAEDCNLNGVLDSCDITGGLDQDQNGVPDDCQNADFIRGDCSANMSFNIADAILSLNYLFGQTTVECLDACDVNDDEVLNIADAVFTLAALFSGGPMPTAPFPNCGEDLVGSGLGCDVFNLGCP